MTAAVLRRRTILVLGLTVATTLAVTGCTQTAGGFFGKRTARPQAEQSIEEVGLPGEPSLTQFEETGTVKAGGEFEDIHFAFDSDRLDEEAMEALRHDVELLQADGGGGIEIEGHCDERGSSEYNLALGARRARAVRDSMASLGIVADRLATVSYGEELPLCKEATEDCWARNRRAHLVDISR